MSHSSSSNYRRNKALIDKFRKELIEMLDDVSEIDKTILNKVGNKTVGRLKENTPVVTGFMRRSWRALPTIKSKTEVKKVIVNTADYASYVNDGHRIVNRKGETVGFVKGKYMLERALSQADKELVKAFEDEVRRVSREHDK